jgi:hypothetical protein
MKGTIQIRVRIPRVVWKWFKIEAAKADVPATDLARQALTQKAAEKVGKP